MKDEDSFFEKVYRIVRLIPKGRVTSYGAIAECLGTRGSARMVGWAMNASHTAVTDIPAHRVVNRTGLPDRKASFRRTFCHAAAPRKRRNRSCK